MPAREEIIRTHFEAWNLRDRQGMVSCFTEDVVVEEDPGFQIGAGTHHGHEGAFALWDQLFDVATDASVEVLGVEDGEDKALVLMNLHAKLRFTEFEGAKEMAHIWHFRGDKAYRVQVFGSHDRARQVFD